jgi:large subunit ribosomal protein L25
METITVNVERREGRGHGKVLRRTGMVPGVFYSRGAATVSLSVNEKELVRRLGSAAGTQLIRLASPSSDLDGKMAIMKEVQVHPVTSAVLHVDFYGIDLTRRLEVHVPLRFIGKAVGVTEGGILQPIRRELTLECLPTAIPAAIEVDVSALGIHDAIHIEDITLPEGVTVVAETNFAVVSVLPPTVEAAPEVAAEAAPAEGEVAAPTEGEGAAPAKEGRQGSAAGKG